MRYKLLVIGAGIAGLLLLLSGLGVFGAGPRLERGQSASTAAAAGVAERAAGHAERTAVAATRSAIATATAAAIPLPAAAAGATPTATRRPDADLRRLPVLPTPTPRPAGTVPHLLNGLPVDMIVVVSDEARANVRQIYAQGRALGRNPRAFAKVGDSTMLWPPFLSSFDWGRYRLGEFGYLQPTIARFAGFFARESLAVRKGMHSWEELDPAQADPEKCLPGETPLTCELRATNASFALIRLGANDSLTPAQFEPALRQIVQTCINLGVVPILGTKPDHYEGPENTINQLIRRLAAEYRVPLWDFDLLAETVPGRGLQPDGLHLKEGGTDDYTDPSSFQFIGPLEDLSALMALDAASRAAEGQ
ncbi:MAG: hypothetical protein N2439_00725 [Anaerolineae bacterium]|nr:hypothetical protein [Anaerolineae bacterium]